MESLGAIARGEVRVYELDERDRDGSNKRRLVCPYPRDIAAAMKILSEIARGGVLPEGKIALPLVSAQTEEVEQTPHIPVLGISTDFRRVTATTVDGTEYTAEVKRGDVIDVEAEECC